MRADWFEIDESNLSEKIEPNKLGKHYMNIVGQGKEDRIAHTFINSPIALLFVMLNELRVKGQRHFPDPRLWKTISDKIKQPESDDRIPCQVS